MTLHVEGLNWSTFLILVTKIMPSIPNSPSTRKTITSINIFYYCSVVKVNKTFAQLILYFNWLRSP